MILFDKVCKRYGSRPWSLHNVSLVVDPQEFVFLVGYSGAGKTTILKLLTREATPTSGSIIVGGLDYSQIKKRDVPRLRRQIGVIFQDFKLLATKTVYENVAFALEITGASRGEIRRIVPRVLSIVGLTTKSASFPDRLSGGEKQRVAIARSLVRQPKLLLADEPTGNLDPKNAWDVIELLLKINSLGTTVLVATHNLEIVSRLKHRVVAVEEGRLVDEIRSPDQQPGSSRRTVTISAKKRIQG